MQPHLPYHHEYQAVDRYVYLNSDDPSLFEIEIDQLDLLKRTYRQYNLPEPDDFPDIAKVDGYGLKPELQFFERERVPRALIELERTIRNELKPRGRARDLSPVRRELRVIERFWDELDNNQDKYSTEIEWLNKIWYMRLMGKFFFCNGKVTYIPGEYFWFLNFWYLNNNQLPQYRDRDRRWAIAFKYASTTTDTFKYVDPETGLPEHNAYGKYEMKDIGRRTIFGINFLKSRRVGDTSKIEAFLVEMATRKIGGKSGIQGKDDMNAETVFTEHCVQPFIKLPIFLKPIWDAAGGIAPKSSLLLDDLDDTAFGIHSIIEYATSSDKAKFDGKFLHFFHGDEFGKLQRSDVNNVVGVVKFCLATGGGSNIHGIGAITSTVDEITDHSAGENFMRFCQRSHFERRDENGNTESGFMNVFFKAPDGMEGFIGPHGESIIGTPTPDQARYIGKTFGAKKFIENKINAYRKNKDWEGLALFRRQHPETFLECFIPPPSAQILRRDLIEGQIQLLQSQPTLQAVRGDLYWVNGIDSQVAWIANPDSGKFYMSKRFEPRETNQRIMRDGVWCPRFMDKYVGSADTFGIDVTLGRKSNGSIVIKWRRDVVNDPLDKELDQVQSDRVILTYSARPDTVSDYCEDVLLAHVYCGAMCYPERNKTNVIDHFLKRGYGGYLLYDYDRNTGKPKPSPGFWNKNELMDAAIRWLQEDVVRNCTRYYHIDLLKELLDFGGRSYLTDLDLTVSMLGVLISERNPFYNMVKGHNNSIDVTGFIPWYNG